jgi:glycosyltransferase involved in cell wall biosynthesis
MKEDLKIAIDARCKPFSDGGVSQAVMSLVRTLGMLDGPETYAIITQSEEGSNWLQPVSGPNQRFVIRERTASRSKLGIHQRLRGALVRRVRKLVVPANSNTWPEVPVSDGFFESLDCDVIHFPTQEFVLCAAPSVYNPHDLQHLHYPQFFKPRDIARRETIYRAGCQFARTVVVGSQWVKDDVLTHYGIGAHKVQVIPEHPPTQLAAELPTDSLSEVKDRYQLQQPFAVYPAVTWPHKNHLRLFEALAYLRDKHSIVIRVVCTGARSNAHWPQIEDAVNEMKLQDQVKFVGFVSERDLRAIYRLSQFLVMPTLFEASSLPIFEAWLEGTPVACSDATALPDQVRDAALLFDPTDTISIADAIARIATDGMLRDQLRSKAYRRLQDFDWERTAKAYRAVYRRAAHRRLTEEDQWLLGWDWMRNPERKMEVA